MSLKRNSCQQCTRYKKLINSFQLMWIIWLTCENNRRKRDERESMFGECHGKELVNDKIVGQDRFENCNMMGKLCWDVVRWCVPVCLSVCLVCGGRYRKKAPKRVCQKDRKKCLWRVTGWWDRQGHFHYQAFLGLSGRCERLLWQTDLCNGTQER